MINSQHRAEDIQLRIQDLEAMRERVVRDIEGQIAALRRMLPEVPGAARYAAQRRWVKENGGWRGWMSEGSFAARKTNSKASAGSSPELREAHPPALIPVGPRLADGKTKNARTGFFNQRGDVDLAALCLTAAGLILAAVVVWGNI